MTLKANLVTSLETAATKAGLTLVSATQGADFHGQPTPIFQLGLPGSTSPPAARTERGLRLRQAESAARDDRAPRRRSQAPAQSAPRLLRHPRRPAHRLRQVPVALPPLHLRRRHLHRPRRNPLADGGTHNLHAKVAASVTVTFAEIVPAMEQPYAETFVYNAIRKTVDLGQLEFLKSGNRQPVPVTTRFYSRWQKKFVFTETDDDERLRYLLSKVYWLSGVLGDSKPVWIADPRDAQYLNTTEADLLRMAGHEAGEGLMTLERRVCRGHSRAAWPAPPEFQARLEAALNFTKPQFNESMRSGHANM